MPGFGGLVEKGLEKELTQIRKELLGDGDSDAWRAIPRKALRRAEVVKKLRDAKGQAVGYAKGQKWGGIYHEDDSELTRLQNEAYGLFNCSNTLYPGTFPGVRKFEAEIVSMALGIVHGHEVGGVGLLSSGGTESIILAVLAYREEGRRRGIAEPEIICGLSAHPALTKACQYLGVTQVKTALDPATMGMDVAKVAGAITPRTVAIYASAPSFTHGVVDPVEALSDLCVRVGGRNSSGAGPRVGLHVDNCLGGFLLSFMSRSETFTRPWDFAVSGVTSMSVDVHKYGLASKGVSVCCFRDASLRRGTYMPSVDGCEGLYITPTLQGSRSGGIIAQAWATLLGTGEDGYEKMAAEMVSLVDRVKAAVGPGSPNPELQLLVEPDAAIVPIVAAPGGALGGTIYQVASVLEAKGWNMFTGQHPPVMSVCLGEQHNRTLGTLLKDLKAAVATVKKNPGMKLEGQCAVYGAAATIPDELLDSVLRSYCDIRLSVKEKK